MNVEEFVADTLRQIFRGVSSAMEAADEAVAEINPRIAGGARSASGVYSDEHVSITDVEFDIAVTTEKEGGGKASVTVFGVDVGGGGNVTHGTVSHVKFRVPVAMPRSADVRRKKGAGGG